MENWKWIKDFENRYEVSDLGRVRSWLSASGRGSMRSEPKVLKPHLMPNGYFMVTLSKASGEKCRFGIHCLVLEAFVGPRPGHPREYHGCHGPNGKTDNSVSNLRWDTVSANQMDRVADGTDGRGEKNHAAVLTEADVLEIRRLLERAKWGDVSRLAVEFGVDQTTISDIKHRRSWAWL